MKKDIDITKNVMKRVASFERRRSYRLLLQFTIIVGVAVGVGLIFIYLAAADIIEWQSFSLLSLFGEDWEIVSEYWRDTLSTFWVELPHEKLLAALIFIILAFIIIFVFRKKIRLIFKKLKSLHNLKI